MSHKIGQRGLLSFYSSGSFPCFLLISSFGEAFEGVFLPISPFAVGGGYIVPFTGLPLFFVTVEEKREVEITVDSVQGIT